MTINDEAKVTMSGKEFKQLLKEIDQVKEAFEDVYPATKELSIATFRYKKAEALNSTLLNRIRATDNYKISYSYLKNINEELVEEIKNLKSNVLNLEQQAIIAKHKGGNYNGLSH